MERDVELRDLLLLIPNERDRARALELLDAADAAQDRLIECPDCGRERPRDAAQDRLDYRDEWCEHLRDTLEVAVLRGQFDPNIRGLLERVLADAPAPDAAQPSREDEQEVYEAIWKRGHKAGLEFGRAERDALRAEKAQPSRGDEPNPEARERERLRKAAQGGVCEVCGRTAEQDAEPQIRSWQRAEAVTRAERDALRAENTRLREALGFYARDGWAPEMQGDTDPAVLIDRGALARAALDAREEGADA